MLTDLGVQRIKTVGELFDPALHEAVAMEDGDGAVEVVCEELQPGYIWAVKSFATLWLK